MLNRNISQSQFDYEAYNNQIHNQNHNSSQHRYFTPPPSYSDISSPSPNSYSITSNSRFSSTGIAASSTPRNNGTISINVTPNSNNSMTNGFAFRPSQPPPAPPPNYVGYTPCFVILYCQTTLFCVVFLFSLLFTTKLALKIVYTLIKSRSIFSIGHLDSVPGIILSSKYI